MQRTLTISSDCCLQYAAMLLLPILLYSKVASCGSHMNNVCLGRPQCHPQHVACEYTAVLLSSIFKQGSSCRSQVSSVCYGRPSCHPQHAARAVWLASTLNVGSLWHSRFSKAYHRHSPCHPQHAACSKPAFCCSRY